MGDDTTIRVKQETWQRLHDLKRPGVSFDEIITELLDESGVEEEEEEDADPETNHALPDGGEDADE